MTCQMMMKLAVHLLVIMLVHRWLPLVKLNVFRWKNVFVKIVGAKLSVGMSSAISVQIAVLNTRNFNSVVHVFLKFRMMWLMCRNVSELMLKIALKSYL
jgi:hypothetical protein